ncbi:disks large-associated protein 1-like [Branchiostoma lanceolatum]|uniref:disks large-associated protein 1-like n=1 Tax=Branchiostoma lanceolatum TaxID=7740 RepID=UPI003454498C
MCSVKGEGPWQDDDPPDDLNNTFILVETCSPAAYLQRVQEVRERLTERCEDTEKYLRWNVPSTVLERVRSAIGQSTLITTNEKSTMARFEAQCREAMTPGGDNPYRPTMNDLEAYWDLVELQVKNIDSLFDQVHLLVKREAV